MTDPTAISASEVKNVQQIEARLVASLAEVLELPPERIERLKPFTDFSLDSIKAFSLTGDLAEWIDQDLPATLFWDYPNVEALARYVAEQLGVVPT